MQIAELEECPRGAVIMLAVPRDAAMMRKQKGVAHILIRQDGVALPAHLHVGRHHVGRYKGKQVIVSAAPKDVDCRHGGQLRVLELHLVHDDNVVPNAVLAKVGTCAFSISRQHHQV